ncbi:protein FAM214A isoform X4 [Heterocephalus glaber]|uniref:Atos homolog protein A n=1 Tax=Heterocephalus glaber TaxID=10181 RepID=A0AAX6T582_HETGA|nr:protein FAM214A isoform X4 [Heterocephalus glaber]
MSSCHAVTAQPSYSFETTAPGRRALPHARDPERGGGEPWRAPTRASRRRCGPDTNMKSERDTLDEYFEYDAEEFLVSLALLITEGRTPECSVKGRTESPHCPPAQSCLPAATRHECSDKLAQCRQARRTRSEVTLLWKSNLPVMVEVMLLPDCCYSDDSPSTEGTNLNDPAVKQDALLLERWILEPVPRQNGGRFVEEKTLLLAVRSFVFFSQLSAWLSVSHGAAPRNILYRISAAEADLQWRFPQTPVEHVFPVPIVSHSMALKVSVQSLPRQSNYPVLSCSIHTNLGLYEDRIQEHERKARQHCSPTEAEQYSANGSQRLCSRQAWTAGPESVPHVRSGPAPEHTAATRNGGPHLASGRKSPYGTSRASLLGSSGLGDMKPHETSMRTWKSVSVVDSGVSSHQSSRQPAGETNPLINSLIQDRQEVIARIAQHLIHCDPSTSHVSTHPFATQESSALHPKLCQASHERDDVRKCKDAFSISFGGPEFTPTEDTSEAKTRGKPDPLRSEPRISGGLHPHHGAGEASPLIGSLLQERQDVIARIAHHLEHIDPAAPRAPQPAFHLHDPSSLPSKVFWNSCDDKHLWKNGNGGSASLPPSKPSLLGDSADGKSLLPDKACSSFRCSSREKSSMEPQVQTRHQHSPCDSVQSGCPETQDRATALLASSHVSQCSDSDVGLISRLENTLEESQLKKQEGSTGIEKQYSDCNNIDNKIFVNKCKGKIINSDHCNPKSFDNLQFNNSKKIDSNMKVNTLEMPEYLNRYENNCSNKDSKKLKTYEQNTQVNSIENYLSKDNEGFKCKKSDQLKNEDKKDSVAEKSRNCSQRKSIKDCLSTCDQLKNTKILESVLNFRLDPLGVVDGFTAEVGASGVFCPTHLTLPVEVSFYSVSDDNAPSPYMGVITLEALGKRGYRVPPSGTIQVTLFNPNKTVVKMFVVMYDLRDMPANHQTFLRQRTFSVPVRPEARRSVGKDSVRHTEERLLRYLIHLRFQSSRSGKIYLHRDVRLLFSRKSMEVDSGAAYELKSYTESPTNPQFSPRC